MKARDDWSRYILGEYSFCSFPDGARVLDVGCGEGNQLRGLRDIGCIAFGVDAWPEAIAHCKTAALPVIWARAEELPIRSCSFDGVVCKVVIPLTDESKSIAEIARVLRANGAAELCCHGSGYYLRYLFRGPGKFRFYGLRTLVNTWLFASTGRKLPGFLGDTLYQSRRRLARYYRAGKVALVRESPSPSFLGFPVFLYQRIRKTPDS